MTHGLFAYEGTLRVPLILYQPRLFPPRVVAAPVRHVDILPTVLDAIGAPIRLASTAVAARRGVRTGAVGPPLPISNRCRRRSIAAGRRCPAWRADRSSTSTCRFRSFTTSPPIPLSRTISWPRAGRRDAELQRLLGRSAARSRRAARGAENAETRERLRSLGYVSGAARQNALHRRRRSEGAGRDRPRRSTTSSRATSAAICRERSRSASASRANDPTCRCRSCTSRFSTTKPATTRAPRRRSSARWRLNPAAMDVAALAGAYLTEAGRAADAVRPLAPYAAAAEPDVDVLNAYGVALATAGKTGEALDAFARANTAGRGNGLALANSAAVYLTNGDRARAGGVFSRRARRRSNPWPRAQRPRRHCGGERRPCRRNRSLAARGGAGSARLSGTLQPRRRVDQKRTPFGCATVLGAATSTLSRLASICPIVNGSAGGSHPIRRNFSQETRKAASVALIQLDFER